MKAALAALSSSEHGKIPVTVIDFPSATSCQHEEIVLSSGV
jgi:hypothetical protein